MAETFAMYCSCGEMVSLLVFVFLVGGVRIRILMENKGWWVNISFPNSIMDIKCPLPRAGYRTIVSFMIEKMVECLFCWIYMKIWDVFKDSGGRAVSFSCD